MSFISRGHVLQGEKHTLLLFARLEFKLIACVLVCNCLYTAFKTFGTGSKGNLILVMCAIQKHCIKFLQGINLVQTQQFYVIEF